MELITRRRLLAALPVACTIPWGLGQEPVLDAEVHPEFPAQPADRVREIVGASHRDLDRVKGMLAESPALAKATWDWGFGDWETALGAASHVGRRDIAEVLIGHGARPDIFTFAMFGALEVVQSAVRSVPGIQRLTGPHGLTLMHHARQGGKDAEPVVQYLTELGDADLRKEPARPSAEETTRYTGVYAFGPDATSTLEVVVMNNGLLAIRRGRNGSTRPLVRLPDHAFHPVGTEAVRIQFIVAEGPASALTVTDGPLFVRAERT